MELTVYITLTVIAIIVVIIGIGCDLYMRAYLKKRATEEEPKDVQFAEFISWNDGERLLIKLEKIHYVEAQENRTMIDCGYDVARRARRIYYVQENFDKVLDIMEGTFEIARRHSPGYDTEPFTTLYEGKKTMSREDFISRITPIEDLEEALFARLEREAERNDEPYGGYNDED